MRKTVLLVCLVALVLVLLLPVAAQAKPTNWGNNVMLKELNGSGVAGNVAIKKVHGQLIVNVWAWGLVPKKEHKQYINGFANGSQAGCPPAMADTNGDGYVSLVEALPYTGSMLLALKPYPKANRRGVINFQRVYRGSDLAALKLDTVPLSRRVVVLHGGWVMPPYGEKMYDQTLPVACGVIR